MNTYTLPFAHGDGFAAQLVEALPAQRQEHPAFKRLARILLGVLEAEDLPDQLDSWHALVSWLQGGPLWSDVYIGAEDVHGPATQRLAVLIDMLQASPPLAAHLRQALQSLLEATDGRNLFAELGIPSDRGFLSEFSDRIARKVLPSPRDDHDLSHLMSRSFDSSRDLQLVLGLQPATLQRLLELLFPVTEPQVGAGLRRAMADGFRLLLARVQGQGLSAKLRGRSSAGAVVESPFVVLGLRGEALLQAWATGLGMDEAVAAWREADAACWAEIQRISLRLEAEGISVDIVYGLDVLERCLVRLNALAAVMHAGRQQPAVVLDLLRQLALAGRDSTSLRHLVRRNLQRLQRRIVDRSGKTGEHYVAESSAEYSHIWIAAAGGGLLTVGTAAMKMAVTGAGFALFIEGLASGLNYAVSFLLLQAFGLILATKQPAMTAAAMAAIIRDRQGEERLDVMVDYAARICRSQLAAAMANVAMVAGGAYLFDAVWRLVVGHSYLTRAEASYVFHALSPVDSGTVFYAALTGVILFLAALIGGWVDNWSVYHRLPQAIAEHRLGARVGQLRMIRLAGVVSRNMSGWATNISLGLMLGMTPVLGKFFGLPLDVRHVTLNSGILSLATASLELPWVGSGLFSLALLGVATMFVLNLGVSFSLSLWTAIRAYELPAEDLRHLRQRLLARLRHRPQDFLWPPKA
ncbi:MAG: site-specific recombinase [Rhodocyclales bacterium]|nr:site-specific recombinase [Rhodocyclales bacterium]